MHVSIDLYKAIKEQNEMKCLTEVTNDFFVVYVKLVIDKKN